MGPRLEAIERALKLSVQYNLRSELMPKDGEALLGLLNSLVQIAGGTEPVSSGIARQALGISDNGN